MQFCTSVFGIYCLVSIDSPKCAPYPGEILEDYLMGRCCNSVVKCEFRATFGGSAHGHTLAAHHCLSEEGRAESVVRFCGADQEYLVRNMPEHKQKDWKRLREDLCKGC